MHLNDKDLHNTLIQWKTQLLPVEHQQSASGLLMYCGLYKLCGWHVSLSLLRFVFLFQIQEGLKGRRVCHHY